MTETLETYVERAGALLDGRFHMDTEANGVAAIRVYDDGLSRGIVIYAAEHVYYDPALMGVAASAVHDAGYTGLLAVRQWAELEAMRSMRAAIRKAGGR